MMIVLTYDINTESREGQKRLTEVAKLCESCGTRVQNSVFEMLIDPKALDTLKAKLLSIVNTKQDSVRFYRLGKNYMPRIDVLGKPQGLACNSSLII